METKVQKWGNSLALRIPKVFAKQINIDHNSAVSITLIDGKIEIVPIPSEKIDIDHLVSQITDENMHDVIDSGAPVGKEIW